MQERKKRSRDLSLPRFARGRRIVLRIRHRERTRDEEDLRGRWSRVWLVEKVFLVLFLSTRHFLQNSASMARGRRGRNGADVSGLVRGLWREERDFATIPRRKEKKGNCASTMKEKSRAKKYSFRRRTIRGQSAIDAS